MTSPLRSFMQFAPLERKRRQLTDITGWQERIKRTAQAPLIDYELGKASKWEKASPERSRLAACLDLVAEPAGAVTQADLNQFDALLLAKQEPTFRKSSALSLSEGHACLEPAAIPRALARFFEWTTSQAFSEMHAIEQMTLCQVRLYEIWPFEAYSWLAADLFSLRVLYARTSLLPLFTPQQADEFQEALSQAFQFVTKPLVDFYARACERACDQVLGQL